MIIVSGKLEIEQGKRDEFIARSKDSIIAARSTNGCIDFSVSPDPVDPNRVNIFEEWNSKSQLEEFRESGPSDNLFDLVKNFDVKERPIG